MKRLKVLAIDNEYLIAMDVGQILSDAFGCSVTVLTPALFRELPGTLRFDVAVVDCGEDKDEFQSIVARLRETNVRLVFTVSDGAFLNGVPDFEDVPVVMKPFECESLENTIASIFDLSRSVDNQTAGSFGQHSRSLCN